MSSLDAKPGDLLRNMMPCDSGGFVLFRAISRRWNARGFVDPEPQGMMIVAGRDLGEVWTVIETHRSWCKVLDARSGTLGWIEMANGPCRSAVFERLEEDAI